jgi:ribosomal protein S8E
LTLSIKTIYPKHRSERRLRRGRRSSALLALLTLPISRVQVTFVPPGFTRKPPKYERFIRPTGLRMKKAHVTHPELKATFQLEIIGVKKNPNGQAYTGLGVITKGKAAGQEAARRVSWRRCCSRRHSATRCCSKPPYNAWCCLCGRHMHPLSSPCPLPGTIVEVNVSELGLVTPGGKVVWGKYAQGRQTSRRLLVQWVSGLVHWPAALASNQSA